MYAWLEGLLLDTVDAAFSLGRYPAPSRERLSACRIVSHRGERDNRTVFENTCAAFDPLRGSGVYGIEFDVRWTRDLMPVVFHDSSLLRLFGNGVRLADLSWQELHRLRPEIPDLHGFVRRYCDEFHLMAEIKPEPYPDPGLQNRRLAEALAPALERKRCHVLSLAPELFKWVPAIPVAQTMGIARLNVRAISAEALSAGRGGFSCHYATLSRARIEAHRRAGQAVGCGFPNSRGVLYREAARGVDYVFTNRGRQLERWRQEALAAVPRQATPAPRG